MRSGKAIALLVLLLLSARVRITARQIPERLSDAAFWHMADSFSEEGGSWDAFYISNEDSYPPAVARLVLNKNQGGVYLGVGAEQNFTYIAAVRPDIAFVIDIRHRHSSRKCSGTPYV